MARKQRENVEGGIYHVYARGNDRNLIYRDDADRHLYLRRLSKTVLAKGWSCLAYCLMPNHLHLLLETPGGDLSSGMQWLQGGYAQIFNSRHKRGGHVFQGRYGAVRMRTAEQLCTVAAYIARNPVEAELCRRPEDWPWSSFRAAIGPSPPKWLDVARLLSHFGADGERARSRYAQLATTT